MRYHNDAVSRVACLEWGWWIMVRCIRIGILVHYCSLKPILQKRLGIG